MESKMENGVSPDIRTFDPNVRMSGLTPFLIPFSTKLRIRMDPTTSLAFPNPLILDHMYFDKAVYQEADSSVYSCNDTVDSSRTIEHRISIGTTNLIMRLLNESIRRPLREIPSFPKIDGQLDEATVQKVEQIFQQFLPRCPQDLGTGSQREDRIETWKRTANILHSFYVTEIPYLKNFLQMTRGLSMDASEAFLGTMCPGSLADAIGCAVVRHVEEEGVRRKEAALAVALEGGMSRQAFDELIQRSISKVMQ
jgi:hypothetical protein